MRMVGQLLSLPAAPESDHAADALALALCHAWSARAGERFARARAAR
jgi:Holliday junction resolvasome RuvABC endonuclease subunit